jgi:hypothetical protein
LFQILIVESALAEASVVPSGEKATAVTAPACPLKVHASIAWPAALLDNMAVETIRSESER